jgi:hypothetical protein
MLTKQSEGTDQSKKKKDKNPLPQSATMAIEFGIQTMMTLVRLFGRNTPEIYGEMAQIATNVVGKLPILALVEEKE